MCADLDLDLRWAGQPDVLLKLQPSQRWATRALSLGKPLCCWRAYPCTSAELPFAEWPRSCHGILCAEQKLAVAEFVPRNHLLAFLTEARVHVLQGG